MTQTVLITGGAGFIGSNVADRLASEGHRVRIYDALARPGVETNLEWLVARHGDRIEPVIADIRDADKLTAAVRGTDAAFHFAAQVAVTTSMVDPASDLAININGTFNLLEAARLADTPIPVIFASTNKVYGDLVQFGSERTERGHYPEDAALAATGVPESQPLDFHTPYGVSKGAADQYVLDYARSYGLPTAVLRMSCVYGERQMGTEDQGWVAHFLIRALEGKPITLYGDGHQVRDILYVGDAVSAYLVPGVRSTGSRVRSSTSAVAPTTRCRCICCSIISRRRWATGSRSKRPTGAPATSAGSWPTPARSTPRSTCRASSIGAPASRDWPTGLPSSAASTCRPARRWPRPALADGAKRDPAADDG